MGQVYKRPQFSSSLWLNSTQNPQLSSSCLRWDKSCTERTHSHSHSHTVRIVTVFPNQSRRGITLWEHSKPVNLQNNTAVIHVSSAPLNIKHMFAVEFPAGSHCIMAQSGFERSASTEHSNEKLILFLHPFVSLRPLRSWMWWISTPLAHCAWQERSFYF